MTDRIEDGGPALLPCPFCGGEAAFGTVKYSEATVAFEQWEQDVFHQVTCTRCSASNLGVVGHRTPSAAAERWNHRVPARQMGVQTGRAAHG